MMDPVGSVEKIIKLGLSIKEAVDTVRRNEECREIRTRVLRVSAILSPLQQEASTGVTAPNDNPAMSAALEDLEESLRRAHTLVAACQEKGATVCLLCTAGKQSRQLRRVQDDISRKVMMVVFATNVQVTIILKRRNRPHPQPQGAVADAAPQGSSSSFPTDDEAVLGRLMGFQRHVGFCYVEEEEQHEDEYASMSTLA